MGRLKPDDARNQVRKAESLLTFLRESPLAQALAAGELELLRSRDLPRDLRPLDNPNR